MEKHKNIRRITGYILAVLYAVGFAGLQVPFLQPLFLKLVPVILIISLLAILFFQVWTPNFITFLITVYVAGFGIEVLGVNTGWIFGNYIYGENLGLQFLNVPLILGVNWILMTYGAGVLSNRIPVHWLVKCLTGAIMMTGTDALMEPVAMKYDFWYWENQLIPVQNFVAWFIISFIFMVLFFKLRFHKHNRIAAWLFILLFLFFLAFNLKYLFS
ncbi:MAG: carotenoid biosynthesis protein [Bacteroidia bacterium]